MLSIFIVCAIGADDIFVFMDAYKQSAYKGPAVNANIATRLSWVWRKSGLAMAITSATTCAAFLCTCFSPMAETRSFGIFAALVILWDYLLVMSLFCSAVIVYHDYFERDPLCSVPLCCGCCVQDCNCSKQSPSPTEKILSSFHDNRVIPQDRVTSFFSGPVTKFICGIKQRILVFICFLAWIIPAVVYVTKLEPTKTAEQFLRSDHPLQYSITILQSEFPTSSEDRGLPIFFAWGINVLDQGGVNQLMDPNFVGRVNLDSGFKYTEECQRKIMDACDDLKYDRSPKRLELMKRAEDGFSEIRCAAWDFAEFAVKNGYTKNVSDPVPYEKVNEALKAYVESPQSNADMAVNMGYDGTRLLFTAIEVESQTLDQWSSMPEDVVLVHYNDFMMLAKELEDKVGDACGTRRVLMTDLEQKWIFMNNQKVYRTSALTGAIIGVAIAFVVLLLATWSALLSILSVISILCTIVSVIGTVTMLGWTLGTIEAILISILAGFSVDYVVHLAHAYAGSSGQNHERVQHAFGEMGTPVLSGMLTSVLASLPLFSCQIVFFAKFGTFLCFTILWSWVFANFGFMSVVATIGSSKNVEKSATVETAGNVGKEMTENVAPKRTEEEPWT
jgi:predicted RND superfamily exporter protein